MNNLKRIILGVFAIALTLAVAVGATMAVFSDTETSTGNTFTAGTLDLNLDGGDTNVVAFTLGNFNPGNQPRHTYLLENVGTINGFLDMEDISVDNNENSCNDPETDAGDTTCDDPGLGQGELQDVVKLRLFLDYGCDGSISVGDNVFYNDLVGNLAANYELDEPLNAGNFVCIVALFDWFNTPDDNKAQGDDMTVNMSFELGETAGQ